MKHVLSFNGQSVGLTKPYQYQVMHLETVGRVQLHYNDGKRWELGHGKDIPAGMSAVDVARIMQRFITGEIELAEYSRLLPY